MASHGDTTANSKINLRRWKRKFWINFLRISMVGLFLALWEFVAGRWIEILLISSPSLIFSAFLSNLESGTLIRHTWVTLTEIGIRTNHYRPIRNSTDCPSTPFYCLAWNRNLVKSGSRFFTDLLFEFLQYLFWHETNGSRIHRSSQTDGCQRI